MSNAIAEPQGHKKICPDCEEPCDGFAGNPLRWPVAQPNPEDPGSMRWHHMGCLVKLREKIRQLNSANIALNQALSEAEEIEVKLRDRIEKITKSMGARIKELEARVEALEEKP